MCLYSDCSLILVYQHKLIIGVRLKKVTETPAYLTPMNSRKSRITSLSVSQDLKEKYSTSSYEAP